MQLWSLIIELATGSSGSVLSAAADTGRCILTEAGYSELRSYTFHMCFPDYTLKASELWAQSLAKEKASVQSLEHNINN